jgi:hypothetical protein
MKRAFVCLAGVLALAACSSSPTGEQFFAVLLGQNEVPPLPVVSSSGNVSFTNHGTTLDYVVIVQSIVGAQTVRLHAGAAGVVGPAIADLYTGPVMGPISNATLVSGTLTSSSFSIPMDSALALMRAGKAYVNLGTTSLPNGEIRGQVTLR